MRSATNLNRIIQSCRARCLPLVQTFSLLLPACLPAYLPSQQASHQFTRSTWTARRLAELEARGLYSSGLSISQPSGRPTDKSNGYKLTEAGSLWFPYELTLSLSPPGKRAHTRLPPVRPSATNQSRLLSLSLSIPLRLRRWTLSSPVSLCGPPKALDCAGTTNRVFTQLPRMLEDIKLQQAGPRNNRTRVQLCASLPLFLDKFTLYPVYLHIHESTPSNIAA